MHRIHTRPFIEYRQIYTRSSSSNPKPCSRHGQLSVSLLACRLLRYVNLVCFLNLGRLGIDVKRRDVGIGFDPGIH